MVLLQRKLYFPKDLEGAQFQGRGSGPPILHSGYGHVHTEKCFMTLFCLLIFSTSTASKNSIRNTVSVIIRKHFQVKSISTAGIKYVIPF